MGGKRDARTWGIDGGSQLRSGGGGVRTVAVPALASNSEERKSPKQQQSYGTSGRINKASGTQLLSGEDRVAKPKIQASIAISKIPNPKAAPKHA